MCGNCCVCSVCSGPINTGKIVYKSRKNEGNIRENDFTEFAKTLLIVCYIKLGSAVLKQRLTQTLAREPNNAINVLLVCRYRLA